MFSTLLQRDNRVLRIVGASPKHPQATDEIVIDEAPLRLALIDYSQRILALSVFRDLSDELHQAEDMALRRTQSTSRVLEEHAARAFGETALVLREVRVALAGHPQFDQPGNSAIRELLRDRLDGSTVISNLVVARADGTVIHDAGNLAGDSGMLMPEPAPTLKSLCGPWCSAAIISARTTSST